MGALVKFESFEFDPGTGELHRHGIRLRLRRQSAEILAMLLERPGELVTRDEIRNRLWPQGTFVEFEHSVNSAVNRLRDALGDSATQPRYIETLARLGYRFAGRIHSTAPADAAPPPVSAASPRTWKIASMAAAVLVAGAVGVWQWGPSGSANGPAVRSIAVLPLTNLSHDPEQDYFADGMTEALTADLARLDKIRVISRTSAMTYRASRKPLPQIARELNVDAVVEGSVLRSGQRVRIVAQLIDASTDTHIWSGSYERGIGEVLRLQAELSQAIAREVKATLAPGPLAARPVIKPEAYELYLKGMFHLNRYTPEGFDKGIAYLKTAIENDPADPYPYAALALGYAMMGHERVPESLSLAKAAARKSLELGGPLPEAFAALGMQAMYAEWNMEAGASGLRRAIELNPNFAEARRNYAWYLRWRGDRQAGIEELKRAEALDPLAPQISADLAWHYLLEGNYDLTLVQTHKALDVNPSSSQALALAGWAHAARAKPADALSLSQKAAANDPAWRWALGRTYALLGMKAEAAAIASAIAVNPRPMDQWGLAVVYSALGDKDQALHWLEAAFRSRFSWMPWNDGFAATPREDLFAALRQDPRYANLARRVATPQTR